MPQGKNFQLVPYNPKVQANPNRHHRKNYKNGLLLIQQGQVISHHHLQNILMVMAKLYVN